MSEMGSLSGCILESDLGAQERARRLRGKALAVSVALEALVLMAILILPLVDPGVLGDRLIVTPLPPYSGSNSLGENHPRTADHQSLMRNETPRLCLFCSQPAAPVHPQIVGNGEDNSANQPPGMGLGPDTGGNGYGPVIPGTDGNNRFPSEIKKPEPAQRIAPQRMSEGVMEAALIHKVQPEYPAIARRVHISGTVTLRAIIGTDGKIRELEVINDNGLLQAAAVAAVREWRYRPTLLNGVAVEVETLITVNFVLDQP
jgi:TonB family protein